MAGFIENRIYITYRNRALESHSQTSCEVLNLCRASCLELRCEWCMQDVLLTAELGRLLSYHRSMAIDVPTILWYVQRVDCISIGQLMSGALHAHKNVYVTAGQARWDGAAKRPKAIRMTHTKSTLLSLFLFTAYELISIHLIEGICLRATSQRATSKHTTYSLSATHQQDASDQAKHH
jgi:hypothetical protein